MKVILIALFSIMAASCVTVPNKPVCVTDAPNHAHCAFMESGAASDFSVDNSGKNQFRQDGRNWNYTQLMKYALIMPPDSYAAIKKTFLNLCHQDPSDCNYDASVQQFANIEGNVKAHMTEDEKAEFEKLVMP